MLGLQAFFFYIFALISVGGALMVVLSSNPVHSVLFLILTFVASAGLFLLAGAEFLALILIVVYVGAVAILFLFVVMMIDLDVGQTKKAAVEYAPIGLIIAGVLLLQLIIAVTGSYYDPTLSTATVLPAPPLEAVSNIEAIGLVLYTRYIFFFQLAGLILFVAMIGAIVLTLRHKEGLKRQSIAVQVARTPATAIEIVKVESGKGILSMEVSLGHYLTVGAILFVTGVFGIFMRRKNIITILMSIELILLAVNINLVAFSAFLNDLAGQVFALFILTVAAAEAAIGLAVLVVFFRNRGSIAVDDVNSMRG